MNKILTTGCSSGLGIYIQDVLQTHSYKRYHNIWTEVDTIIHSGWGGNINLPYLYIKDNIKLIKKLFKIKQRKFIFISSVDVYPKNKKIHYENDYINLNDIQGIYGITKLAAEQYVQANSKNHLILRCGAFLGPNMRNNNLKKTANGQEINIHEKSSFNLIRYETVAAFIKLAIENDLTGIYNIVANDNVRLKDLAINNSGFCKFKYKTPKLSYEKLLKVSPALVKSSKTHWGEWLKYDL